MAQSKKKKPQQDSKKQTRVPRIYLDTNIIRDWIRSRNRNSIVLISNIKDRKWDCVTSMFSYMELLDIEKEEIFFHRKVRLGWDINKIIRGRTQKDLSSGDLDDALEPIQLFNTKDKIVRTLELTKQGWNIALAISSKSGLTAADSIHLAVAGESGCDILVTHDEDFIKLAKPFLMSWEEWDRIHICTPKEVFANLIELGYKISP